MLSIGHARRRASIHHPRRRDRRIGLESADEINYARYGAGGDAVRFEQSHATDRHKAAAYGKAEPVAGEHGRVDEFLDGLVEWTEACCETGRIESVSSSISRKQFDDEGPSSFSWTQGGASNPFVVNIRKGPGNFDVKGPFVFDASACETRIGSIATEETLAVDENRYPLKGIITLDYPEERVRIMFENGAPRFEFTDGQAGFYLPAEEVRPAFDAPRC